MVAKKKEQSLIEQREAAVTEFIDKVSIIKDPGNMYPLLTYELTKDDDFLVSQREVTEPELFDLFRSFKKAMAEITYTLGYPILPTKELLCMYFGWTTARYDEYEDICPTVMGAIDDYLVDNLLSSAGESSAASAMARYRASVAGKHGFGQVKSTEAEGKGGRKVDDRPIAEIMNELNALGNGKKK